MTTQPKVSDWRTYVHKAQHIRLTVMHMINISDWSSYNHKAQHIRLTDVRPTYQTDSHRTTKPNTSDLRTYAHKAQHVRLTVTWPQSPTHQTGRRTSTKPNISDWQTYVHKAQHIRLKNVRPQSPTIRLTDGCPQSQTYPRSFYMHIDTQNKIKACNSRNEEETSYMLSTYRCSC